MLYFSKVRILKFSPFSNIDTSNWSSEFVFLLDVHWETKLFSFSMLVISSIDVNKWQHYCIFTLKKLDGYFMLKQWKTRDKIFYGHKHIEIINLPFINLRRKERAPVVVQSCQIFSIALISYTQALNDSPFWDAPVQNLFKNENLIYIFLTVHFLLLYLIVNSLIGTLEKLKNIKIFKHYLEISISLMKILWKMFDFDSSHT